MDFDVAVVGAGPAGGNAALRLARAGFSVALIEEHREIGEPVQCGGLVTPRVFDYVDAKHTVLHRVHGAEIYSPRGRRITIDGDETEAVVVDRAKFDRTIAEQALRAGAEPFLGAQAQGAALEDGGVRLHLLRDGAPLELTCRLLLGADGVRSNVAKWFGILKPRKILPGFEMDMAGVTGDPGLVKLYLGSRFAPGFFGWIIPAGETARVGLCVGEGNAWAYLQEMLRWGPVQQYTAKAQPLLYIAGGIPLGFPRRTFADRVLVVGDAACQAKATSGGGIFTALLCSTLAAETAVEALKRGNCSARFLRRYHRAWTRSIGKELRKDLAIHETYAKLTDAQLEEVFGLLDNPVILDLISRRGDIDFPSKVGWAILREEPRLLKYAGRALAAMIRKEIPFLTPERTTRPPSGG